MNALEEFLREHTTATSTTRASARGFEVQIDIGDHHARAEAEDATTAGWRAAMKMREHLREVGYVEQRVGLDANDRAAAHFKLVRLTRSMFEELPEYSCTLPTGTTIGKLWRCRWPYREQPGVPVRWFMGTYVPSELPGQVGIVWREIEIVEEPTAAL